MSAKIQNMLVFMMCTAALVAMAIIFLCAGQVVRGESTEIHAQTQMIELSASWCKPCKDMEPVITELEKEQYNITRYDIDKDKHISAAFRPRVVPTFIFLRGGKEFSRIEGAVSKNQLYDNFHSVGVARIEVQTAKGVVFYTGAFVRKAGKLAVIVSAKALRGAVRIVVKMTNGEPRKAVIQSIDHRADRAVLVLVNPC